MGKKAKPNFMTPATQESSLEKWTPLGFDSPYGSVDWTDKGYNMSLDPAYDETGAFGDYGDIRSSLLGDFGLTSAERAGQLDEYGQAFMDKSLEYSAPQLRAMNYGRGQAGSRMAADSYADLVNKASTDSVLRREELRSLDEQLKMQQLGQVEAGLSNTLGRGLNMGNFMLGGVGKTEAAKQGSINNMRQYVSDTNQLEAERYQRELESDAAQMRRWQGAASMAAAIPTRGASLMMLPTGDLGGKGGLDIKNLGTMMSTISPSMFGNFNGATPNTQTLGNQQLMQGNPYSGGTMYGANQYAQQNPFKFVGM